jgi:putative peptidoglycan lipid II flippase
VFYSLQDTRTPVKVAVICLVAYTLGAALTYRPLGTFGLALSISLSSTLNMLLLVWCLRRKIGLLGLREVLRSFVRTAVIAAGAGGAAYAIVRGVEWANTPLTIFNITRMLLAIGASVVTFIIGAWLFRSPELSEILAAIRRHRRP